MEQFARSIRDATLWLDAHGFGPQERLLFVLVIALLSLLLSFRALRRASRIGGLPGVHSLGDRVERSTLQVNDLRSRVESDREQLLEEIRTLRERVRVLEGGKPREETQESPHSPKKKSDVGVLSADDAPSRSLRSGVEKTRTHFLSRLAGLFRGRGGLTKELLEELEELLISSDIGVRTTQKLLADVEQQLREHSVLDEQGVRDILRGRMREILDRSRAPEILPVRRGTDPLVILVVGVNGVGKTTTIGKLATRFCKGGAKVLLGAADTFRAAAGEQIEIWAERAGVTVLRGADGAKPATVAYESLQRARNEGFDVVIIDTAGRLHTRVNLMNELAGVLAVIGKECPGAPHEVLLVVDATTGQNALEQAREFHSRAPLTGIVLTKLDGTPKGGIIIAIQDELGVPIRYIGVGESAADLKPFSADEFLEALFNEEEGEKVFTAEQGKASLRATRRRPGTDTAAA